MSDSGLVPKQTNPEPQAACFGAVPETLGVASLSYKRLVPGLLIAALEGSLPKASSHHRYNPAS
jgi:hypothetical protein